MLDLTSTVVRNFRRTAEWARRNNRGVAVTQAESTVVPVELLPEVQLSLLDHAVWDIATVKRLPRTAALKLLYQNRESDSSTFAKIHDYGGPALTVLELIPRTTPCDCSDYLSCRACRLQGGRRPHEDCRECIDPVPASPELPLGEALYTLLVVEYPDERLVPFVAREGRRLYVLVPTDQDEVKVLGPDTYTLDRISQLFPDLLRAEVL